MSGRGETKSGAKTGLGSLVSLTAEMRRTTYEQVYRALRRALVTGQIPAGTHLIETELAAQLGVSRTPVRDALRRLEGDGFAERGGMGGLRSVTIDRAEIHNLFLVREELDKLAARLACVRAESGQWDELRALLDTMGAVSVEHGHASKEFSQAHLAFHTLIYRIAFGARFAGLLGNHLLEYMEIAADLSYRDPARTRPAVEQHQELVVELASGDVNRAVAAAQAHARRSADDAQGAATDADKPENSGKGLFVQRMFLNGTAMSGQEGHGVIAGATLLGAVSTAPHYRFFSVRDEFPGLLPVDSGGVSIEGELYEMTDELLFDKLLPQEPRELELGSIELADSRTVGAMILRPERIHADDKVTDIADFGGWRRYQDHLAANLRARALLGH